VAVTTEVIPDSSIPVLDHGFVRLDAAMADDLSVVNAARVSFARRRDEVDDADAGLIRFLMRDRHGTPFEHNSFRFHIRCPIFVAREWFRHRIGSFNEFSMRYAKATDDFYVPEAEDVRSQVGKPGAYSFEPVDDELAERFHKLSSPEFAAAFGKASARWLSRDCHRSQYGYPFRVAIELALENRHRAVTLASFTCSGSEVTHERGSGRQGSCAARPAQRTPLPRRALPERGDLRAAHL